MMKKIVSTLLLMTLCVFFIPSTASAARQDNDIVYVLKSSLYGGLTGALVGSAFLAFRDKPGDHLKDIRIGAGIGIILGTLYGLTKVSGAFVEVKDGTINVQAPMIRFDVDSKTSDVRAIVELLNVPF